MVKTLKISEEAHRELSRLMGELRAKNGHSRTFDDVIKYLLKREGEK